MVPTPQTAYRVLCLLPPGNPDWQGARVYKWAGGMQTAAWVAGAAPLASGRIIAIWGVTHQTAKFTGQCYNSYPPMQGRAAACVLSAYVFK